MSASREKKNRMNPQEKPVAEKKHGKSFFIAIAAIAAAILLIAAIVIFKGPLFYNHATAVTVGDHNVNPVTVRYFYVNSFSNLVSTYTSYFGDYADTMLSSQFEDPDHVEETIYDEETGETWGDNMMSQAMTSIAQTYALYDDAQAAGFTLSEDYEAELTSTSQTYELYASYYGVDADTLIASNYGTGASLDSFMDYARITTVASAYQESVYNGFTFSAEDLAAEYEANPSDYNSYTYHSYTVTAEYEDDADEETIAAAEEAAKAAADVIAASGSVEEYLNAVAADKGDESYADGSVTLRSNYGKSAITSVYSDWVTDAARQEGDVEVFESDYGYYVVCYLSCDTNDYATVNARVIRIDAEEAEDGTVDWESATTSLENLQTDFASAETVDDSLFSTLAYTYSADTNTSSYGGAYTNISKGTFSDAIQNWLYDEARQEGDCTTIQDDSSYYWIYFESKEATYRDYQVENALRENAYTEWYASYENLAEPVQHKFGMSYVDRTLVYSAS